MFIFLAGVIAILSCCNDVMPSKQSVYCQSETVNNVKSIDKNMIYYNVRGVWLYLPLVYLEKWQYEDAGRFASSPNSDEKWVTDGLPFDFLMPSARWVAATEGHAGTSLRSGQKGSAPLSSSEFIVQASLEYPWIEPPISDDFLTPQEMINNLSKGGLIDDDRYRDEYGLIKYALVQEGSLQTYSYVDSEIQLIFNCSLEKHEPYPTCAATVWWPREKLGIRMLFPTRQVKNWRDVVETSRSIVGSWKVLRKNRALYRNKNEILWSRIN